MVRVLREHVPLDKLQALDTPLPAP